MPRAAEECREMSGNCQGISHCRVVTPTLFMQIKYDDDDAVE